MSLPPYTLGLGHEAMALDPRAPAFSLKHDVAVVEDGLALLPGAWRVKPNLRALMRAALNAIQARADENWSLYTGASFDLATGVALDQWGDRWGTTRGDFSDEEFRMWITAVALADGCTGTTDGLLDVLIAATQPRVAEFIPLVGGCYQLQVFREEFMTEFHRGRVRRLMASLVGAAEVQVVESVVGARGPYREDGLTTADGPLPRVV